MKVETKVVHGKGITVDSASRAIAPAIQTAAVFSFKCAEHGARLFAGEEEGYIYTRLGNPTLRLLEEKMAFLEGGESAAAFASGMAAISTTILALCDAGDNIIASSPIYGGTFALLSKLLPRWGIEIRWAQATKFVQQIEKNKLIDERTKLFLIETPANPTLDLVDLAEAANMAKTYNIPTAVDQTFATFYFQKCLDFGIDIAIYSTTKFIGGHSDAIGGITISTRDLMRKIKDETLIDLGGVMSPFNAFLFLRGLKTLAVRMDRHNCNAMKIAQYLEEHPRIENVFYPYLESNPQYALAKKQMSGGSGLLSFNIKGGKEKGKTFLDNLNLLCIAVSLGSVNTLIEHPASMTHSTYSAEELKEAGIPEGLIRVSIGIENAEDLIEDMDQSLNKTFS
ncbi:MAG: aminotransferase class I/II-fold pyridoxal phosphate-dependent enzyme [Candidatus Cloacimonadota bacterium]|nr:MAG: aminotransferase class I/II-fold pyridoxal phosphate-dependent enzyme [Candidatus Cloacimonadota bacterium]